MTIHIAKKGEHRTIRALYRTAFPRDERAPFFLLARRARQNRAEMLVAEERGTFIGFAYTMRRQNLVYLFYFAVAKDKRGSGHGSEVLRLLKTYYEGSVIFLAMEPPDDAASNRQERIKRRAFYLRSGFLDVPFQIREASVIYDVMSTSREINPAEYSALIKAWAGALVLRLVPMTIIDPQTAPRNHG